MRYCADTWYILGLFSKDLKAVRIMEGVREGKDRLYIPLTVFAEATKKLLQRGVSKEEIDTFFDSVGSSDKIQLIIPDVMIARESARVSLGYGLSLLDSFVAATSKMVGADILLSGDSDYLPLVKKKYLKVQSW